MEYHLQAIAVGIGKNIFVELQTLLLVTTQEVDLDTSNAQLLQPCHLAIARQGGIHAVLRRLRCIVGIAVTVIPQQQFDTFAISIAVQLDNAVAPNLLVPPVVDQHILVTHSGRQVNHLYLVLVVDTLVAPQQPAPRIAARLVVLRGFIERIYHIIGYRGLYDRLQRGAQRDGTPRGTAWQRDACTVTSQSVQLANIGEGDGIAIDGLVVAEVRGAIVRAYARLADEYPTIRHLKQTGKGKALTKGRAFCHGDISFVILLIRWFGTLPAHHWQTLWCQKRCCTFGEVKRRRLAIDDGTQSTLPFRLEGITISNIVVRHAEGDSQGQSLTIGIGNISLVGHIVS